MTILKSVLIAALFGQVAQSAAPTDAKVNGQPTVVAQSAETFYAGIRAEVAGLLQQRLSASQIGAKEVESLLASLNVCTNKLHDARYDEKLNRAAQQVEKLNTQVLSVLKDPDNKEVFAPGLEPEKCLNQIRLQKSTGAVIDKKIARLRSTLEELKQICGVLEPVTAPQQLSERLKVRLTQLLDEWNDEGGSRKPTQVAAPTEVREAVPAASKLTHAPEPTEVPKAYSVVSVRASAPKRGLQAVREPAQVEPSPTVAKVAKMAQDGVSEKVMLKYVRNSKDSYSLPTADHILYLRSKGVPSSVITAMLEREERIASR